MAIPTRLLALAVFLLLLVSVWTGVVHGWHGLWTRQREAPRDGSYGACGTIPRVVHFVFGLWESNATLTPKHEDALMTWRRHNPAWAIKVCVDSLHIAIAFHPPALRDEVGYG